MSMHKITIDSNIEHLKDSYVKTMSNKGKGSRSEALLDKLITNIKCGNIIVLDSAYDVIPYIQKLKERYYALLIAHPKDFPAIELSFNSIIPTKDIANVKLRKVKDRNGNTLVTPKNLFLYEEIVKCLRYDYIRTKVFPTIMRQIGVKTCVYCNAQFAITTKANQTFYQLDHFYPKSRYPYLSGSFFNLQPCCSSCNLHKLDNDEMTHGKYNISMWKEMDDDEDDLYKFEIDSASLANYQINQDRDVLLMKFLAANSSLAETVKLAEKMDKTFKLSQLYNEHSDVAEEIIWKKQIYSKSYIDSLKEAFGTAYGDLSSDFDRFIIGTYLDKRDIYKRPLAKFIQDITEQLHFEI